MDGILLINKPKGVTSRDVVNDVMKKLNIKKVGHTGTLDPLATGVLVICVGKATRLVNDLTATTKEYIAEVILGIETDTLDITGNILKNDNPKCNKKQIEEALKSMIGEYDQEVPLYSAIKINGKKLYQYARENIKIELPKRKVIIYELELISEVIYEEDYIKFQIRCLVSKGTYIRSLIRDLAHNLNTIGVMSNLTRIKQGRFTLDQCIDIDHITSREIIPIAKVIDEIPHIIVDNILKKDLFNGKIIDNKYDSNEVLFVGQDNNAIAIYHIYDKDNSKLKPKIVFGGKI